MKMLPLGAAFSNGSKSNDLIPVNKSMLCARLKARWPGLFHLNIFQKAKRAMTMGAARYSSKKAWAPPVGLPPIGC